MKINNHNVNFDTVGELYTFNHCLFAKVSNQSNELKPYD